MIVVRGMWFVDKQPNLVAGISDSISFDFLRNEELDELVWDAGLDLSSSCFGFYLRSRDYRYKLIVELHNQGETKFNFFFKLEEIVRRILINKNVQLLIIEKPVPSKFRQGASPLIELKGLIESQWNSSIPSVANSIKDGIFPQEWKSRMVIAGKGESRKKDKRGMAEDICKHFPELISFLPHTRQDKRHGYDGFDAVGILEGYMEKNFTVDNQFKNAGSKVSKRKILSFFRYIPIEEFRKNPYQGLDKIIPSSYKPIFKTYDNDSSLYENIIMCSTNTLTSSSKCSVLIITDGLGVLSMLWSMDMDLKPKHVMIALVMDKKDVSADMKKFLESIGYKAMLFV